MIIKINKNDLYYDGRNWFIPSWLHDKFANSPSKIAVSVKMGKKRKLIKGKVEKRWEWGPFEPYNEYIFHVTPKGHDKLNKFVHNKL